jgi:hypothetical protein
MQVVICIDAKQLYAGPDSVRLLPFSPMPGDCGEKTRPFYFFAVLETIITTCGSRQMAACKNKGRPSSKVR